METFFYLGALSLHKKQTLLCSVFDQNVATTEKEKIETQLCTAGQSVCMEEHGWSQRYCLRTSRPLNMFTYYDADRKVLLACVAREQISERHAKELLEAQGKYMSEHVTNAQIEDGAPHSLTKALKEPLRRLMVTHSKDSLRSAQDKVDAVQRQMTENMGKVVDTLHQMDDLESNAREMNDGAHQFQMGSAKIKQRNQLKHYKMMGALAITFVVFCLVIIPMICWLDSDSSSSSSDR